MASLVAPLSNNGPSTVHGPISPAWPKGFLISAGRVISAFLGGTSSTSVSESVEVFGTASDWTSTGWPEVGAITSGATDAVAGMVRIPSTTEAVRYLHDASGLTWEQLSILLGVSRRAVHMWAAGGAMSSGHETTLRRITALIDQLPAATPSERRAAILLPRRGGLSLYDQLRAERTRGERITAAPFGFEYLIGAPDETA